MAGEYPYIARAGWPYVAAALLPALLLQFLAGFPWALPFWILAAALAFLFRDPERKVPPMPLAVVSPVDGVVTTVEKARDPHLDREAVRIGLHMDPLGAYTTRSPVEGKIMEVWFTPAQGRPRGSGEGGRRRKRDRYAIWVQTDEADDVVLVIRVLPRRPRPRCYVNIGERIGQGQRCGMVGFGGEVSVFVPSGSRIEVEPGKRVRAGSDILATLVH